MDDDLAEAQKSFAGALRATRRIKRPRTFADLGRNAFLRPVYHNNVAKAGLVSALAARYPVVKAPRRKLNFSKSWKARLYESAETSALAKFMLYYGEKFPEFIDAINPARTVPYLGAVAEIDMARAGSPIISARRATCFESLILQCFRRGNLRGCA